MSLFTRFPALRFLVFGSLAIVALSSPLRAQDLRKWMPNVGDQFVYHYTYGCDCVFNYGQNTPQREDDTIRYSIDTIDYFVDSLHPHVVFGYSFSLSDSNNATYSFAVEHTTNLSVMAAQHAQRYDFGNSTSNMFKLGTDSLLSQTVSVSDQGSASYSLSYSPKLRWFLSEGGVALDPSDNEMSRLTLIYALSSPSSVVGKASNISNSFTNCAVSEDGVLLDGMFNLNKTESVELSLLDLLGRPVRAWSMDLAAGESEVHLNIADVPSGVYFLRIFAAGVEEMRKVVIVH